MKLIDLINAYESLEKLFNYGYFSAKENYYLSKLNQTVKKEIEAYHKARNLLLAKYGKTENNYNYEIHANNIETFNNELEELNNQIINIIIDESKFKLFIDKIDSIDSELPIQKKLALNSNDILLLNKIMTIYEVGE